MKGIDDWRWMVGAGVYLDDCKKEIAIIHNDLHRHQHSIILNITVTTFFIILFFFIMMTIVGRYLEKDYRIFHNFFKRAANFAIRINQDDLRFQEFHELSGYANQMLIDRSKAQQQLATEHERLSVTLQAIVDAVIATDAKGQIILMNPVAEKLTGYQQAAARQQPLTEVFKLVDKNTRKPLPNPITEVLQKQSTVTLKNHTILRARDGDEYDIEDSAAPIYDHQQTVIGVVLVFRDVTAKLASERELLRQRQLESLGTLAGGIAHDFNNLMTGIFGNIALAKDFLEAKNPAAEFLVTAENSLGRAKALTAQLLTFAKGGAPITQIQTINEIIRETASFSLRGSKLKLEFQIVPDLWAADVDKGQLSQVISNLVINAEQAMAGRSGTILVRAENIDNQENETANIPLPDKKLIKISITDEGCGIADANIDKIFEPYFTTKELGNGLGLATCHSIISRHRGHLDFTSTLNQGSTFSIYLPAAAPADSVSATTPAPIKKAKAPVENLTSTRILVMDDEPQIGEMIQRITKQMSITTVWVDDGSKAVRTYQQAFSENQTFALTIVDLTVPGGMGGQETAREILKIDPEARIIVASGYANDPVIANFQDYGFHGALIKPYSIAEFKKIISAIL